MSTYISVRFWNRVGQIRNDLGQGLSFHEAHVRSIEQAVAEMYSEACSPWFDERAFR